MPRNPNARRPRSAVGMKDIAQRLGVSTGTVDRALNGKPGINPDTRARVLAVAQILGYRPNLAARYLSSRKQLRISVYLPQCSSLFWEALREGIREAAAPFAPSLAVEFCTYPSIGDGDVPLLARAWSEKIDGLVIAAANPSALAPLLEEAARCSIPVACVVTDVPDSRRLLSVSADPFSIGALAGELVGRFVPGGGQVALVAGSLASKAHADQVRGFVSSLSKVSPRLMLGAIVESHDDEREVHRRMRAMFSTHPRLKGLYVSTSDSLPVLRAAEREGRLAALSVVVTDLFPELFDWIRAGKVAATIYQRPLTQGRVALQSLYQFLQSRVTPTVNQRIVAPYPVMSSNLDLVLESLRNADAVSLTDQEQHSAAVREL
jgi:LacI family transcriptional regulator